MAGAALLEPRPEDALAPLDFTGLGCVVIHRSVLERMPAPWFDTKAEDKFFYQRAIGLGFTPWVDRSVVCGHLVRDVQVGALDFIAYSKIVKFEEEEHGTGSEQ